jgi:hypothetical protein
MASLRARAALRKAGGEWHDMRHHQAKIVPAPDAGWVGYIGKEFWKTTPSIREFMKHSRFFSVTFDGNVFSATRLVAQKARELFEADRLSLRRACSKSK